MRRKREFKRRTLITARLHHIEVDMGKRGLWRASLALGMLVLCFVGWSPTAQAQQASLQQVLTKVKAEFRAKQYRKVLERLKRLNTRPAPRSASERRTLSALFAYMAVSLYQDKKPVLAVGAFQRALRLDSNVALPAGTLGAARLFFAKPKRDFQERTAFRDPLVSVAAAKSSKDSSLWVTVALITGAVSIVALVSGVVAGVNAKVNAEEAVNLFKQGRAKDFSNPLLAPTLVEVHERAMTQSTIANILYGVGGLAGAASVSTGLVAFFQQRSGPVTASTRTPATMAQPKVHLLATQE